MKTVRELIKVEFKLFLREPIAVFFTFVFPFIPLLLMGSIFGAQPAMPGFRVIDVYVPALIAMLIAYFGLMSIPIALSEYREQGVLKRYKASPLAMPTVLLAHLVVQFLLLLVVSLLLALVAELVFDLRFAGNLGLVLLTIWVGCLALFTLGFAIFGLCTGPRTTQAVGSTLFFLMLFSSGAAIPRRQFPPWLQQATDYIPLSHLVDALIALWTGEPLRSQAWSFSILLGVAIVSFLFAQRTFRWWDA